MRPSQLQGDAAGGLQAQRKLIKIAKVAFPLGDGVTVAQQTLNLFV